MNNLSNIYDTNIYNLYPELIDKYNYITHLLYPNNTIIFQTEIERTYVNKYPDNFIILVFPVFKLYWSNVFLCLNNNKIYLDKDNTKLLTLYEMNTILTNSKLIFNNDIIIIEPYNLYLTYSAYAYSTVLNNNKFKLATLNIHQLYGIVDDANKLGILSNSSVKSINSNYLFTFEKSDLRSTQIDVQLKVFDIFIKRDNCIVSGGTGIGKTTIIPKLFWWFNFLFDGFSEFESNLSSKSIKEFIFDTDIIKKKTVLSLPRKALIRSMGMTYINSLGYKDINGAPINLRYKDVKLEKQYYNSTNNFISQFTLSVNRITLNIIKNTNTILIDEMHEHDKFGDITIAVCNKKKNKFKIRNIILISATIEFEIDNVKRFFKKINQIYIPGKSLYPVNELEIINVDILNIIRSNLPNLGYTIIIFFETISKINEQYKYILNNLNNSKCKLYKIHSKIENINEIINKIEKNKHYIHIILSTNYLESSITISNAKVVIDNGLMYLKEFLTGKITYITESMSRQRKGRVGRMSPGTYIRLYQYKKLNNNLKFINHQYLWDYIIIFKYYGLDLKKDYFVIPDDLTRVDNTINYLLKKQIDINNNIYYIFRLYNKIELRMIEYLSVYLNYDNNKIYLLENFIKNIESKIISYELTLLLKSLNVQCKLVRKRKYNDIYVCKFILLDAYDGIPYFNMYYNINDDIPNIDETYYIICEDPFKIIR
ncbi:RNA helicase NPH-II [Alphaentomopoxvirus acuprea]|uniref:RNA helicase NPH-II n=1 Tax=Alphaentomopoxvirus acuprea TaxID=62099 RepID=W6JL25_9POXV|nr:RNA helicase NPH-II [Anomala cuprea entomopoxvirus]BAO49530.1 RNA helicase NPH-II [Anomala cuprea entomopoxvirus]